MAAATANIFDLRNLLARRFPQSPLPAATRLRTGVPLLDEAAGGGLSKNAITELISPARSATRSVAGGPHLGAGSASLVARLVETAHRDRYFVALVDGCDSFDPVPLGNARLQNLLWVRCRKASDAIKSADFLLRDGNFPLVIVDLVLNLREETRKIPQTSWYRLQRLVEAVPTVCLVLTRQSMIASAQLKLVLENEWTLHALEDENAMSQLGVQVRRSHLPDIKLAKAG